MCYVQWGLNENHIKKKKSDLFILHWQILAQQNKTPKQWQEKNYKIK